MLRVKSTSPSSIATGAVKDTWGGVGGSLGLGLAVVSTACFDSIFSSPSSKGKGMMRGGGVSAGVGANAANLEVPKSTVSPLNIPHSMFLRVSTPSIPLFLCVIVVVLVVVPVVSIS